jgi:hypothetical protein
MGEECALRTKNFEFAYSFSSVQNGRVLVDCCKGEVCLLGDFLFCKLNSSSCGRRLVWLGKSLLRGKCFWEQDLQEGQCALINQNKVKCGIASTADIREKGGWSLRSQQIQIYKSLITICFCKWLLGFNCYFYESDIQVHIGIGFLSSWRWDVTLKMLAWL